jgi:DNA-binding MarR family transcriptional regulator
VVASEQFIKDEIGSLFHLTLKLHHLNKDVGRKFKLSLVQLFVLQRLRHLPAVSLQALSVAIGVKASTLTQTIRRLVRKDYVFVAQDPKDSRKKILSLTRSGKEAIDAMDGKLNCVFRSLGKDQLKTIEKTLSCLTQFKEALMA